MSLLSVRILISLGRRVVGMSDRRSFLKVLVGLPVVGVLPVPEPVLVMHRYGLKKFDHSLYSRIRVTCVKPSGSVGLVGAAGGAHPVSGSCRRRLP